MQHLTDRGVARSLTDTRGRSGTVTKLVDSGTRQYHINRVSWQSVSVTWFRGLPEGCADVKFLVPRRTKILERLPGDFGKYSGAGDDLLCSTAWVRTRHSHLTFSSGRCMGCFCASRNADWLIDHGPDLSQGTSTEIRGSCYKPPPFIASTGFSACSSPADRSARCPEIDTP